MYIVGIDIGKHHHEAALIDQQGNVIGKSLRFANCFSGFQRFMDFLKTHVADLSQMEIGLEATGHYWLPLYGHLRNAGFPVLVINPVQSDALRNLYIRQTKNDSRDSFIIANVIRFGRYSETAVAAPDIHALPELCRHRFFVVDMISDLKRKVIALLDQVFHEYEKLFSDTFGMTSVQLLTEYATPEEIVAVDTAKLCELIAKACRGRFGYDKVVQIQDAVRNSFGILLSCDSLGLLIQQCLEQIQSLEQTVSCIEQEIARLYGKCDSQLTTITGIGSVLAVVIISEIGDISCVESSAKLAAFAGIDLTGMQSGDFIGTRCKMSKRGSPYLRHAFGLLPTLPPFTIPPSGSFTTRNVLRESLTWSP